MRRERFELRPAQRVSPLVRRLEEVERGERWETHRPREGQEGVGRSACRVGGFSRGWNAGARDRGRLAG
jgi:hypothetical protein